MSKKQNKMTKQILQEAQINIYAPLWAKVLAGVIGWGLVIVLFGLVVAGAVGLVRYVF